MMENIKGSFKNHRVYKVAICSLKIRYKIKVYTYKQWVLHICLYGLQKIDGPKAIPYATETFLNKCKLRKLQQKGQMLPECLNDFKTILLIKLTINYVLQFWQQRGVLEMPRCRRNSCVKRVLPSSQLQEGCSSSNRWNQSPSSFMINH